jgi:hypothetical protein
MRNDRRAKQHRATVGDDTVQRSLRDVLRNGVDPLVIAGGVGGPVHLLLGDSYRPDGAQSSASSTGSGCFSR